VGQVASGSGVAEEAVDQNACPTASIAVNEDARKICERRRDRSLHGLPLEPIITLAKHDSLQSAVTGDELQFVPQVWPVVLLGFGIKQVDAGKVTLTAPGSSQSARAADSEELAPPTRIMQAAKEVIQPDTMAADHNQIRGLHALRQ